MIGYFDYTVLLTYISLVSATLGIIVSVSGNGHPFLGVLFLMFSGLCDAFDGKVARTKKERTKAQRNYGIQIDSLSDIIAFGVLPVCIGLALVKCKLMPYLCENDLQTKIIFAAITLISIIYVLNALIRLAYFNVTEEELQASGAAKREFYTGLPVTSAALIFPTFMLISRLVTVDISHLYYVIMLLTGLAFIVKFKVKKPNMKWILVMVGIGAIEFILFILFKAVLKR